MFCFQNYSCYITLLCCCSKLTVIAPAVASAHTSPSVPIISSSSSSIIRHLEWSWKLAFHPGVMGNTRPSTPGSRYALTPFGLLTLAAGWPCLLPSLLLRAPLRSASLRLPVCATLDAHPSGARATCSARELRLTSGARRPRRFAPPPARRLHIWVTFGYGICCGCLRYDTGPVSAALRPREPASLLCAIKRLSLLGGWINYLPDFQLRDPYSRFVDSSQHLIQIFVVLTCFSVDKLF